MGKMGRCYLTNYAFETVDVFTEKRFGGNPLAVFTDARGLDTGTMQAISAELNLSESAFVLPPVDPANDATVRIFNRTAEMPFAGHPSIGTAVVLSRRRHHAGEVMRLEVQAGLVTATILRASNGTPIGARIEAPQPLTTGAILDPAAIAACIGISSTHIVQNRHPPIEMSVGVTFVAVEVAAAALASTAPDINRFRETRAAMAGNGDRLSILLYARDSDGWRARMFAPLAGTYEDPATGSANAALAALLLSLGDDETASFTARQGLEMGRPSTLHLTATRTPMGITATVAGRCVAMFTGQFDDQTTG